MKIDFDGDLRGHGLAIQSRRSEAPAVDRLNGLFIQSHAQALPDANVVWAWPSLPTTNNSSTIPCAFALRASSEKLGSGL